MREIAEKATIGRQVGPSRKDPSTEPRAGFVLPLVEIPAAHVAPIRRPARDHCHSRRFYGWNPVDPARGPAIHSCRTASVDCSRPTSTCLLSPQNRGSRVWLDIIPFGVVIAARAIGVERYRSK